MAKAAQNWINQLHHAEKWYDEVRLVNWVHDEWQTEVKDGLFVKLEKQTLVDHVAEEQIKGLEEAGRQLSMIIPIVGGKPKIADNWAGTH